MSQFVVGRWFPIFIHAWNCYYFNDGNKALLLIYFTYNTICPHVFAVQGKSLMLLFSVQILLMNGLVPALIKNLAEYVTRHGRAHDKITTLPDSAGSVSPSGSGMSPQSRVGGLSPSPWSPYSSPPASPASIYSPLCLSEDELEATPVLLDEDVNIEVKVVEFYIYCIV